MPMLHERQRTPSAAPRLEPAATSQNPMNRAAVQPLSARGGVRGRHALDVWPYRVRYDVVGHEVTLYRVRHRRDVYRDQGVPWP